MAEPWYAKKEAYARAKPGQTVKRVFGSFYQIFGTPTSVETPRPWEEETGVWKWPELWSELSSGKWEKGFEAQGLGEEYDPTLPTDVPDYPSISGLMDDLLNLRKREGRRKGRRSTKITRGELGTLDLSETGLFPI